MSAPAASSAGRLFPAITGMNRHFWCGGADGRLHILRCGDCGRWIHPYAARCPACRSAKIAPEEVSGRGRVVGFSINHQAWIPGLEVPYAVAIVELEEQSGLRLMSDLPRIPVDAVRIGLPVKVYFEPHGEIFLPLFEAA
jgi:uncharacterized OB-fold protein